MVVVLVFALEVVLAPFFADVVLAIGTVDLTTNVEPEIDVTFPDANRLVATPEGIVPLGKLPRGKVPPGGLNPLLVPPDRVMPNPPVQEAVGASLRTRPSLL